MGIKISVIGMQRKIKNLRLCNFEKKKFVTKGDKDSKEGKQFDKFNFVQDIEKALLAKEIDIAVHSAKDMPAKLDPQRSSILCLSI